MWTCPIHIREHTCLGPRRVPCAPCPDSHPQPRAPTAWWGRGQDPLISQIRNHSSISGGLGRWLGRGHQRLGPFGSDPGVQVSKVSFKGRAVLMWLPLYLLKEGKQAAAPSCPRMAAQILGDTPCPPSCPNTTSLISPTAGLSSHQSSDEGAD